MSYASKLRLSNLDLVNAQRKQPVQQTQNKNAEDLESARRTTAFVSIYNKPEAARAKVKTQMCRSIQNGIPCKFGSKCSFAHSKEELRVQKCAFGTTCKTKNSKTNPCRYDHSEEYTPEPAERFSLAQEMKTYWEQEELQAEAIVTKFRATRPKLEPFIIDISDDEPENEYGLRIFIPINNEPDIKVEEECSIDEDNEMKAFMAINSLMIPHIIINNSMNLFEDGNPFNVDSLAVLP